MSDNPHAKHRARMKEQFLRNGLDIFAPHQALELLLFYAIPRKDVNELAHLLLTRFGGLQQVLDADPQALCAIPGISQHTATLLNLCGQLMHRCQREQAKEIENFHSYTTIGTYLTKQFAGERVERTRLMCLNNRGELLGCPVVGEGSVAATEVNLRTIMKAALQHEATIAVIAHNHPAGFATPSNDDITVTRVVRDALQTVGVELMDHIIVADNDYVSLRQSAQFAEIFLTK